MDHRYGNEFAIYIRQNWKRFLDDCFIIWNSDISLSDFHSELNSLNPQIRFTINRNVNKMPFLDILVLITEDNEIVTDIFSKDTDTHMYLTFYSNHPKHVKLNIPFNLASRIMTISRSELVCNKRLEELKVYLTFYSNHPKHVKLNKPFNLASRIITITRSELVRNKILEELKVYLKKQQYPEQVIDYGFKRH
ncbi:unnamed protein product [Mytilus coruscus]|uniref:Helix-turn-helix domain-containing protein n=1 Tax=Mytilus coruscus TaxID=42192 RepID=A0A6J8DYK3_MYTCO|nr:unnamed protein product [Mytilus coruscus]